MPPPCESRTISRSRRRTRLRSTALPTCRDTVNPMRTGPSSARRRACTTKAPTDARKPFAAARKSVRCLNRCMVVADIAAADLAAADLAAADLAAADLAAADLAAADLTAELAADEMRSRTEPL